MAYKALSGIRVADLGIVTAGASTSAILADLGAEVIKVEGPTYTDPFREWTGKSDGAAWWNDSPQFRATNRNKRSVCMDLKSDEGRRLFLDLVAHSDVVVENFRAGVLDRLNLGWDVLSSVNPRIVLASISSQGQSGPAASKTSFGSTLEASSGMASLMRYNDAGSPHVTGRGINYPDQVVSLFAAGTVLSALIERKRTGRGVYLDLSQRELTSYLIGESLTAAAQGSQAPSFRPGPPGGIYGVYRCADGQSVAISARLDKQAALTGAIGAGGDEAALRTWLAARDAPSAAVALRAAGIDAEVLLKANGYTDPQGLQPQNSVGRDTQGRQVKGLPIRLGAKDCPAYSDAPTLGQDNAYMAKELLGLTDARFAELLSSGVLTDRPASVAGGD